MKILFYIENLGPGGKERRLVELIKGLSKHPNIEMELVLTSEDIHYTDIIDTGIRIHYTIRKNLKRDPRLFWSFYRIAKNSKPDIIHVWGSMSALYAIPAKILLGITLINNQIADFNVAGKNSLLNKTNFRFADVIISNSFSGLKSYNINKKNKFVIHNGFSFDRFENLESERGVRKKFDLKTPLIVAMVATFYRKKDYSSFIKAALKILETNKEVTFLCVGAGDYTDYSRMVPIEHRNHIMFLGQQTNVESIMNICDIGVLSTFSEGISNSIMEFMALGKPVVATDGGGTLELVVDNESGFLVPAKSPDLLANKIDYLLNCQICREKMGAFGKNRISNNFSIEKMIDSFIEIYKQYVNN